MGRGRPWNFDAIRPASSHSVARSPTLGSPPVSGRVELRFRVAAAPVTRVTCVTRVTQRSDRGPAAGQEAGREHRSREVPWPIPGTTEYSLLCDSPRGPLVVSCRPTSPHSVNNYPPTFTLRGKSVPARLHRPFEDGSPSSEKSDVMGGLQSAAGGTHNETEQLAARDLFSLCGSLASWNV